MTDTAELMAFVELISRLTASDEWEPGGGPDDVGEDSITALDILIHKARLLVAENNP